VGVTRIESNRNRHFGLKIESKSIENRNLEIVTSLITEELRIHCTDHCDRCRHVSAVNFQLCAAVVWLKMEKCWPLTLWHLLVIWVQP